MLYHVFINSFFFIIFKACPYNEKETWSREAKKEFKLIANNRKAEVRLSESNNWPIQFAKLHLELPANYQKLTDHVKNPFYIIKHETCCPSFWFDLYIDLKKNANQFEKLISFFTCLTLEKSCQDFLASNFVI